jgi:hypothetical protein
MAMKIAWVYPFRKEHGNAFYARSYARSLARHATVVELDTAACLEGDREAYRRINACDIAHVQYEVSFFNSARGNGYRSLRRRIRIPLAVTLHEIYREFPDVYPRGKIVGWWPVRMAKLFLYDLRHPSCTAYRRHLTERFGATLIVVHYPYQKRILIDRGVPASMIVTVSHPVVAIPPPPGDNPWPTAATAPLRLGSSGFINPHFDYEQLFAVLERLRRPWHFTWIGDIRRTEEEELVTELRRRVGERGWGERFAITGWVSEERLADHLRRLHVYLALFTNRSTSGTIMKALAARAMVIARNLPLTEDLNRDAALMLTVGDDPAEVLGAIERLGACQRTRRTLRANLDRFVESTTYDAKADELLGHYRKVLAR